MSSGATSVEGAARDTVRGARGAAALEAPVPR